MKKNQSQTQVHKLPATDAQTCCYRLIGTTPMLIHAFGQKSFTQMLEKMVGRRADGTPLDKEREPKDLEAEFQGAMAKNKRGEHAVPVKWVKAGLLTAASAGNKAINGSALRRGCYVLGFTIPILKANGEKFDDPEKQIDVVRVGPWSNRQPDVRARPRYDDWMIEIALRVFPTQIPMAHVTWVLDAMGKLVGLGDYRPENEGTYGQFEVEPLPESHFNRIVKACGSPPVDLVVPAALQTAMREVGVSYKEVADEAEKQKGGGKKKGTTRRPTNGTSEAHSEDGEA